MKWFSPRIIWWGWACLIGTAILITGFWIWDSKNYPIPLESFSDNPTHFQKLINVLRDSRENRLWTGFGDDLTLIYEFNDPIEKPDRWGELEINFRNESVTVEIDGRKTHRVDRATGTILWNQLVENGILDLPRIGAATGGLGNLLRLEKDPVYFPGRSHFFEFECLREREIHRILVEFHDNIESAIEKEKKAPPKLRQGKNLDTIPRAFVDLR